MRKVIIVFFITYLVCSCGNVGKKLSTGWHRNILHDKPGDHTVPLENSTTPTNSVSESGNSLDKDNSTPTETSNSESTTNTSSSQAGDNNNKDQLIENSGKLIGTWKGRHYNSDLKIRFVVTSNPGYEQTATNGSFEVTSYDEEESMIMSVTSITSENGNSEFGHLKIIFGSPLSAPSYVTKRIERSKIFPFHKLSGMWELLCLYKYSTEIYQNVKYEYLKLDCGSGSGLIGLTEYPTEMFNSYTLEKAKNR